MMKQIVRAQLQRLRRAAMARQTGQAMLLLDSSAPFDFVALPIDTVLSYELNRMFDVKQVRVLGHESPRGSCNR